jgi:8-oxo-dGTP diphosphatase
MVKIDLAGCLIQDSQQNILMLHRSDPQKLQWETPGGKLKPGENPEVAAIREIKEEICVPVKLTRLVGENDFSEGEQNYHYYWYEGKIVSGKPMIGEPTKFDQLKYLSWSEIELLQNQLSANTKNLLKAYQEKKIIL